MEEKNYQQQFMKPLFQFAKYYSENSGNKNKNVQQ
jgi:hypothetical protein